MPLEMSVAQTLIKIKIALDRREEPFLGYIAKFHKFVPLTDGEIEALTARNEDGYDNGLKDDDPRNWKYLMGVDVCANIYYNAKSLAKLSEVVVCGVVAHELMHTVLRHTTKRRKDYNHHIMNIAEDIVVNWHCQKMGFQLPEPVDPEFGLMPRYDNTVQFKVRLCEHKKKSECSSGCFKVIRIDNIPKKTSVMIYHEIINQLTQKQQGKMGQCSCPMCHGTGHVPRQAGGQGQQQGQSQQGQGQQQGQGGGRQQQQQQGQGGGQQDPNCPMCGGKGKTAPKLDGQFDFHKFDEKSQSNNPNDPGSDQYWRFKVAEAWQYCKQRGTQAGHMMGMLGELLEPKVDWKSILRNLIVTGIGDETSWRKPKRSAICRGIYLPTTYSEEVKAVVAIDTSGSISDKDLQTFVTEVANILSTYPKVDLDVLVCDCDLKAYQYSERDLDTVKDVPLHGRGGTSHEPVVEWILKERPDAKLLIAFTDGISDIQQTFPRLPGSCRKVIALSERYRGIEQEMERYGETLIINKDDKDDGDDE